jgi:hypothetical protein
MMIFTDNNATSREEGLIMMDCTSFAKELPDLVLTPGATPSIGAVAHLRICPPCAEEYIGLQNTFGLLDEWLIPEPTAYFDQKMAVRLREEQAAPRMNWFERLEARLTLNTGRNFRPAMAAALALALLVGGGSYAELNGAFEHTFATQASATVNDLQILDKNEQAFQVLDELQQDETSAPAIQPDGRTGSTDQPAS